jgi:hypothetical protein
LEGPEKPGMIDLNGTHHLLVFGGIILFGGKHKYAFLP